MLSALANFSVRHRWLVVVTWLVLVAGAAGLARTAGGSFNDDMTLSGTDSQQAYDTLRERYPTLAGDGMQVVIHDDEGVSSPAVKGAVEAAVAETRDQLDVAAVTSPYSGPQPMVSADGRTAMTTVQFADRTKDIPDGAVDAAQRAFEPVRDLGVQVEFGGPAAQSESGPSGTEVLGLLAAVVVLLVAFGSVFAMAIPLVSALLALGLSLSVIEIAASWVTIGTSGPVVAAMIGLGVGIDYALLVVTRHREGLAVGHEPGESIRIAMTTAGRSVLVAGATVVVAILSLYLIGIPFVSALGLASAIAVGTALLASVTLLPALLAILGRNLDRVRVRSLRFDHVGGAENGWHRWARLVQRRRWVAATVATMLLLVLAIPLLSLRLGTADGGSQAQGTTQRKAYDLVEDSFGAGWTGPLLVTADYGPDATSGEVAAWAGQLRSALQTTEGIAQVTPPQVDPTGRTAVLTVVPTGSPDDASTEALLHRLRSGELADTAGSPETHVGGATATNVDLADKLGGRMLWFMGLVVGLAFLLLLVEFRSLFVAGMAVVMNLLAVGAAYGPVVAVFQWGWWPAGLIGVEPGPVESFAPVMLFAVLFGLSTDYAVFLLSRVHEVFRATGDASRAVREGLAATARVILAAASVMVVVFASFMLNEQRVVNMFGFGLAMAIAVYALVAMLVLVPAVLITVGRSEWWLPDRLARKLPVMHVEPEEDPFEAELTTGERDHLEVT